MDEATALRIAEISRPILGLFSEYGRVRDPHDALSALIFSRLGLDYNGPGLDKTAVDERKNHFSMWFTSVGQDPFAEVFKSSDFTKEEQAVITYVFSWGYPIYRTVCEEYDEGSLEEEKRTCVVDTWSEFISSELSSEEKAALFPHLNEDVATYLQLFKCMDAYFDTGEPEDIDHPLSNGIDLYDMFLDIVAEAVEQIRSGYDEIDEIPPIVVNGFLDFVFQNIGTGAYFFVFINSEVKEYLQLKEEYGADPTLDELDNILHDPFGVFANEFDKLKYTPNVAQFGGDGIVMFYDYSGAAERMNPLYRPCVDAFSTLFQKWVREVKKT